MRLCSQATRPSSALIAATTAENCALSRRNEGVAEHSDRHMRGRALIVEDDHDLRIVMSILLTTEGWDVTAAASLEEAAAHLRDLPNLLLLDVQLGGRDAEDLLAQLAFRADAPVTVLVDVSEEESALARTYGLPSAPRPTEVDSLMHTIDLALSQLRRPGALRATWGSVRLSIPSLA